MNADEPFGDRARERFGDEVAHVHVLRLLGHMRVQLADGTRILLDENGVQIGRTLPPV